MTLSRPVRDERAAFVTFIRHRAATLELMRSLAAHGLGLGLSYTNPAPRLSQDGKPLVTIPLTDAGAEAIVLARPKALAPPAGHDALIALLTPIFAAPHLAA